MKQCNNKDKVTGNVVRLNYIFLTISATTLYMQ